MITFASNISDLFYYCAVKQIMLKSYVASALNLKLRTGLFGSI